VTVPDGFQVIDVTGLYLVPGLINAHVHGGYDESRLKAWAAGGVTTVRDLSAAPPAENLFRARNSLRADPSNARLVAAGPFITVPDGYPIVPWGAQALTVTTVKDAARTANQLIDEGADIIKISLEAGRGFGRVIKVLSADQAKAVVDAAHARGRRVSAHITAAEDIARCLSAGVDDIAHMPSDTASADLAATVSSRGIYWVPTLELWHNVGAAYGIRAVGNLRRFVAAGGPVALGTDYAGYAAEFDLGLPIREMEWMLEAGLTNREVLLAATRNAAVVCGLGRELGTIQTGWIADILVLGADPLDDLHALQDLRYVIHNGQVIRQPQ
jgi:imidazolonepropionase-like amidohydrolase